MSKTNKDESPPGLDKVYELTRRLVQVPKSEVDAEQKAADRRKRRKKKANENK